MSDIKIEITKNAHAIDAIFKLAEDLRKQATYLENNADKLCGSIPAVFIEKTPQDNFAIYISTANIVPGDPLEEHLGPYTDYLVFRIDEWAYAELAAAINK